MNICPSYLFIIITIIIFSIIPLLLHINLIAIFFLILNRLFVEQPPPQILSIPHPILHALTVQNYYNEPSPLDFNAAGKTWTCSIGDACLYAYVQVWFLLQKLMSVLPSHRTNLGLLWLFAWDFLFLYKFILKQLVHVLHLLLIHQSLPIDQACWPFLYQFLAFLCLKCILWVRLNLYLWFVDLASNDASKFRVIHGVFWDDGKVEGAGSILRIRQAMRVGILGLFHIELVCFLVHFADKSFVILSLFDARPCLLKRICECAYGGGFVVFFDALSLN